MKYLRIAVVLASGFCGQALAQDADAPADWSGWWGGMSVGGVNQDYDTDGLSDGRRFCIAEASGPGASASCRIGDDYIEFGANAEIGDNFAFIDRRYDQAGGPTADVSFGGNGFATTIDIEDSFGIPYLGAAIAEASEGADQVSASSYALFDTFDFGNRPRLSDRWGAFGAHLRRDWQFENRFVAGVEAEMAVLSQGGTGWSAQSSVVGDQISLVASQSVDIGTEALGSIRFRSGYAVGSVLPYLTAGLGFGRFEASQDKALSGVDTLVVSSSERVSEWAAAPVLGGGISWMLTDRIALTSEALYYFFDHDLTFSDNQAIGVGDAWSATVKISLKLD